MPEASHATTPRALAHQGAARDAGFEPCPRDDACAFCRGARAPVALADCVDAVYCLSVRDQPHRLNRITADFHANGLCRHATFFRPPRGRHLPGAIWASHRAIARHALDHRRRRVLILEDDVHFIRPWPAIVQRLRQALAVIPADWWGLYLGHWPLQAHFIRRNLVQSRSGCTHAYVANQPLLRWLAETEPLDPKVPVWWMVGTSVDAAFANLPGMYAMFRMVALQRFMGDYRIDPRVDATGRPRRLTDIDRWRPLLMHFLIFSCMRPAELIAAALSPLHRRLMRR